MLALLCVSAFIYIVGSVEDYCLIYRNLMSVRLSVQVLCNGFMCACVSFAFSLSPCTCMHSHVHPYARVRDWQYIHACVHLYHGIELCVTL